MTYVFSGLIGFDRSLDWSWLMDQLGGVQRDLDTPLEGRVHALGADYRLHDPEDWERAILVDFSRRSGDAPLVGLVVECFGGVCDQRAVLLQNGGRRGFWDTPKNNTSALEQAFEAAGHGVSGSAMAFLERGVFAFDDTANMRRALALARKNYGNTGSNPSVGCVLVDDRGELLAEAATAEGGTPHAEEQVLEEAQSLAVGATAYVTLEPCRERSAGGLSCSERLIDAGVKRVVVSIADEHPNGAGGLERLSDAGVDIATGICADAATALYKDFFEHARSRDETS
ncbi:MAG: bifunctional diaminohydroxyphosphoribosylaminopyrimidine deaminase/5-amino-6-(5-phosphoribosylamino)uracil reductase RibD [Pseudomonadota bacterium]